MNKPATITAHVDADTLAIVEQLAALEGLTVEDFAAEAIQRVAESEADFRAFMREGIDQLDRGEGIPREVVKAEIETMVARHEARCHD